MAALAAIAPIAAAGATLAGGALSAVGTVAGGNAAAQAGQMAQSASGVAANADLVDAANQNSMLQYKAAQEGQAANWTRAVSQRDALETQRTTGLALSTLQARAAASGGGAADPTVQTLAGQIASRGEYESLAAIASGENRARGIQDQATGDQLTGQSILQGGSLRAQSDLMSGNAAAAAGKAQQRSSYLSAAGTLVGSAGSAFGNYGRMKTGTPNPFSGLGL